MACRWVVRFHWRRVQAAVAGFLRGAVASALCAGCWSARAWARGSCCVERTTRFASCWQGARAGVGEGVSRWLGPFFGAVASALCAGCWSARASGPRAVLRGAHDSLRLVLAGGGWRGGGRVAVAGSFFFGGWPARCARVAGQRGLEPAGLVVWSARLASPRAGRGRVAWGRACRGGRVFFLGGRWPARCARVAGQRGLGPAGRVVWSARLASPRAGRGVVTWRGWLA
jgi:hypothetical protein